MLNIEPARITSTFLGIERKPGVHKGGFTFYITFAGDHMAPRAYGGYNLQVIPKDAHGDHIGAPWTGPMLKGLLDTLEVPSWEQLRQYQVRLRRDDDGEIVAVGHPTKDRWFTFEAYEYVFHVDRPVLFKDVDRDEASDDAA